MTIKILTDLTSDSKITAQTITALTDPSALKCQKKLLWGKWEEKNK